MKLIISLTSASNSITMLAIEGKLSLGYNLYERYNFPGRAHKKEYLI